MLRTKQERIVALSTLDRLERIHPSKLSMSAAAPPA
jgi:hypothetical protein